MLLNVFSQHRLSEGRNLRKRLKERLREAGGDSSRFYSSFDTVGDIAIIRVPKEGSDEMQIAAKAIMSCNKGIKTVLVQTTKVAGDYRLRRLTWISGENKTRTIYKEHGCSFAVDVDTCYFSPRLSGERLRISRLVQPFETVVNMFAGVGCFSILISRQVPTAKIYSIDLNPVAFQFMNKNVCLNRVFEKVLPILGDSKEVIETRLQKIADRVLMPLPEKAIEYLPAALSALKTSGGWIHVHAFEHAAKAEDAIGQVKGKVRNSLETSCVSFDFGVVREVRSIGPNWYQIVADVQIFSSSQSRSN